MKPEADDRPWYYEENWRWSQNGTELYCNDENDLVLWPRNVPEDAILAVDGWEFVMTGGYNGQEYRAKKRAALIENAPVLARVLNELLEHGGSRKSGYNASKYYDAKAIAERLLHTLMGETNVRDS